MHHMHRRAATGTWLLNLEFPFNIVMGLLKALTDRTELLVFLFLECAYMMERGTLCISMLCDMYMVDEWPENIPS